VNGYAYKMTPKTMTIALWALYVDFTRG